MWTNILVCNYLEGSVRGRIDSHSKASIAFVITIEFDPTESHYHKCKMHHVQRTHVNPAGRPAPRVHGI